MSDIDLSKLPKTFYRVSLKALIYDDQNRLLVSRDSLDTWEIPGGGWDNTENLDDCVRREVHEELQVTVTSIGAIRFVYQNHSDSGFTKLCIALPVTIDSHNFILENDDLVETRFVRRDEFLTLPFHYNEQSIVHYADQIWLQP